MKKKKAGEKETPQLSQLEKELKRLEEKSRFRKTLFSTIGILLNVAAISVLIVTLLLPVLQIYGSSMTPTLTEGNIVLSLKGETFEQGDIIAFYYNNKILVKRVIAFAGDWIDIDIHGTVTVNGNILDEPYIVDKALGECTIELPYQVPDGKIFVMGDHRSTSQDSRSDVVGCVSEEQIVGRIIFKIWPLEEFGWIR